MSFIYCGFSTESMMNFMANHKNTIIFRLQKIKGNNDWDLHVSNRTYGALRIKGSLTIVLINAFKPYMEEAKAERELWKKAFDDIQNLVNRSVQ